MKQPKRLICGLNIGTITAIFGGLFALVVTTERGHVGKVANTDHDIGADIPNHAPQNSESFEVLIGRGVRVAYD